MDLPSELAELPLDQRVDVLVPGLPREPVEKPLGVTELVVGEKAGPAEPPCVQPGSLDVVVEELGVVGPEELLDRVRDPLVRAS